jgi:hypothetical protein
MPAALGPGRQDFDALIRRRADAVTTETPEGPANADLLEALAHAFADEVDRANDARQYLRQRPLDYVDAVVLTGQAGPLVVDAVEYDRAPTYWQTKAGQVDSIIRGRDLDAYLRTGEARYAEAIGLQ